MLDSITCPVCNMTSHHPKDIEHGWCGNCHAYTGDNQPRTHQARAIRLLVEEAINDALLIYRSPQGIGDLEIMAIADNCARKIEGVPHEG